MDTATVEAMPAESEEAAQYPANPIITMAEVSRCFEAIEALLKNEGAQTLSAVRVSSRCNRDQRTEKPLHDERW